jgi:signal transduction histidine kinase
MVKAAWVAPAYLSIAWTLMISYQLFTEAAVTTVVTGLKSLVPSLGIWLVARQDMIIFVYAFAWVFVLSSVIPSKILGKERSVLVQFVVCLSLTLSAFLILDILKNSFGTVVDQLFSFAYLLNNPILAVLYLTIPYVLMLSLDLKTRNSNKREKQRIANLTENYLRNAERADQQK